MHCHADLQLRGGCVLAPASLQFLTKNERRPSVPHRRGIGLAWHRCRALIVALIAPWAGSLVSARRAGHNRGSPERPGQRRRMADVRARLPQPASAAEPDHARQRQGPAPVWAFSTGGALAGLEATPLMREGVLYFSTDYSRVFALTPARAPPVVFRARVRGGAGDHALLRSGQPGRRLKDDLVFVNTLMPACTRSTARTAAWSGSRPSTTGRRR